MDPVMYQFIAAVLVLISGTVLSILTMLGSLKFAETGDGRAGYAIATLILFIATMCCYAAILQHKLL